MSRDMGKDPLSFNYSKSFSQRNETIRSTSLPSFYKNIYAGGLVKENFIGIISILTIIFLSNDSLIQKYEIHLVMLALVLTQFALSRSNIEINDKFIKVRTLFHWIAGSTTHSLDSINTIHIEKNNKLGKFIFWIIFIIGLSYILLFLSHLCRKNCWRTYLKYRRDYFLFWLELYHVCHIKIRLPDSNQL